MNKRANKNITILIFDITTKIIYDLYLRIQFGNAIDNVQFIE